MKMVIMRSKFSQESDKEAFVAEQSTNMALMDYRAYKLRLSCFNFQ